MENDYVKMIERMRDLKMKEQIADPDRIATESEVDKAMADFVKESEDLHISKETGMKLMRPPNTVKEVIDTLKEVD